MSVFDSVVKRMQGLAARGAAASGNPVQIGGTYRSSPAAVDDGDAVDLLMDSSGRAAVSISAALPAGANAIGKLAANSGVDIGDVDILSIAAGDNNIGNVDIVSLPASTNTIEVVGDAAHDAAIAGNPVRIGGRAISADVAAVATGDTADLVTDLTGKLVVSPYAMYSYFLSGVTADITDTTATQVIASQGAGFRVYVTAILITNSDTTTGTVVKLTDGSGGTTLWRGYAGANGGGFALTLPVPIFTTAATALYVQCETTGATVQVSVAGYKGR